MRCSEDGCREESHGYDIEKAYDRDMRPVYAVFYECLNGHKFVSEYDRTDEAVDVELAAITTV